MARSQTPRRRATASSDAPAPAATPSAASSAPATSRARSGSISNKSGLPEAILARTEKPAPLVARNPSWPAWDLPPTWVIVWMCAASLIRLWEVLGRPQSFSELLTAHTAQVPSDTAGQWYGRPGYEAYAILEILLTVWTLYLVNYNQSVSIPMALLGNAATFFKIVLALAMDHKTTHDWSASLVELAETKDLRASIPYLFLALHGFSIIALVDRMAVYLP